MVKMTKPCPDCGNTMNYRHVFSMYYCAACGHMETPEISAAELPPCPACEPSCLRCAWRIGCGKTPTAELECFTPVNDFCQHCGRPLTVQGLEKFQRLVKLYEKEEKVNGQ